MITPLANYNASRFAGSINIKLKKLKDQRMNGDLTVGACYGRRGRDNFNKSLNYGREIWRGSIIQQK